MYALQWGVDHDVVVPVDAGSLKVPELGNVNVNGVKAPVNIAERDKNKGK